MDTVGAYEAKTRLAELLDRVQRGDTITITRHGVPVAMLVGPGGGTKRPVAEAIAELRALRKGLRLEGLSVRKLIAEGRR